MFWQIQMHEEDANLQMILWRAYATDEVREYYVLMVTYDITSEAYLAICTLLQLANDEECRFPRSALAVREHTYIDDTAGRRRYFEGHIES